RLNLHFAPPLRTRVPSSPAPRSRGRRLTAQRLLPSGSPAQSPPYESAVESLSPITGHAANSRKDARPFSSAFGSFLFKRTTLCVLVSAPFCAGSATQT